VNARTASVQTLRDRGDISGVADRFSSDSAMNQNFLSLAKG